MARQFSVSVSEWQSHASLAVPASADFAGGECFGVGLASALDEDVVVEAGQSAPGRLRGGSAAA